MASIEIKSSDLKIGDYVREHSLSDRKSYPKIVSHITDSSVEFISLVPKFNTSDIENFRNVKIKNLKIYGDAYNGHAKFPLKGNEHLIIESKKSKERKTYKHRGIMRNHTYYKISGNDITFSYDFYIR